MFGNPVVAAALGALLGGALTVLSQRAAASVAPSDPARGLAFLAAMTAVRLGMALCALLFFYLFARTALAAFGLALGFSFVAGLAFEAVKASRLNASHTSA